MRLDPMTDTAIRELALKSVEGRVVGTWNVKPDMWRLVFMPLAFVDTTMWRRWKRQKVAHVYGILGEDPTAQRAINGHPMFGQCHVITERDFLKLKIAANMAAKQRAAFLAGHR